MDTSKLATKADLQELKQSTKADLQELKQSTKADTERLENKLDKLQNTLDSFVGIVEDLRTENTIGAHHTRELQERVDTLEQKVTKIDAARHAQ